VALHRFLAFLTRDAHWLGNLIKGEAQLIIQNGELNRSVMKANDLSENDLLEDMRMNGNMQSFKKVKAAYYERNGQVSIVKD
jgi:uncharacterized membrane protein YcaP (DUF421 family)